MSQYLEAQRHVARKLKQDWRVAVLGKGIDQTFKLGEKLARFSYREADGGEEIFILYYTPVSKALQRYAQQLGNFLHYQKRFRPENDEWWNAFRAKLEHTSELLCRSCTGTMLGPPLTRNMKDVQTFVEVLEGCPVDIPKRLRSGERFEAGISYPGKFPAKFEANAYIWRPNHDFN